METLTIIIIAIVVMLSGLYLADRHIFKDRYFFNDFEEDDD